MIQYEKFNFVRIGQIYPILYTKLKSSVRIYKFSQKKKESLHMT
jgi:hypothetical protein